MASKLFMSFIKYGVGKKYAALEIQEERRIIAVKRNRFMVKFCGKYF